MAKMAKRGAVGALLTLALAGGIFFAVRSAFVGPYPAPPVGVYGAPLLFGSASWLIWLAPFAGLLAAGLSPRVDSHVEGDRVLRHDGVAILEHWTHGVATVILLLTGFMLGSVWLPRLVAGRVQAAAVLNVHYVGAALFVFAAFYYGTNTVLSGRLREHLPGSIGGSLRDAVAHYRAVFGGGEFPRDGKYFASEHLTYPIAAIGTIVILLSGLLKVAAFAFDIPGGLMTAATVSHDIAAVVLGVFLVAHAIAGAVVPWSWPLLRSMFTGFVTAEYARTHHKAWFDELAGGEPSEPAKPDERRIA